MTASPRRRRRTLLLGLAAVLLLADGALGWALARRRTAAAPDARVSAAFAVLRRDGLGPALDALERAAAEDSVVLRDGHQLAHALGREAVAEHGGDASVIRDCRPTFASGCYHGVVEASVGAGRGIDMARLKAMCLAAGSSDRPGPAYECLHGLGHGVLGALGYDVEAALRQCDLLGSDFDDWCHAGVFMEGLNHAMGMPAGMVMEHGPAPARPFAIDRTDPYSPCDRFDDPDARACWLFQGFVILQADGFDAGAALGTCDGAPAARVERCYESVGHQVAGLFQRDDGWILGECGRGRADRAEHCAGGAALALTYMDWSGRRAARFCAAAPEGWREACYRAAAGLLRDLAAPARRDAFCRGAGPAYRDLCRRAAALDGSG